MNFWINFWTIFFFASLVLFAALSVVIAIGGVFNIYALLKSLTAREKQLKTGKNVAKQ